MIVAYTDGACNPNPGPMGIGVAIYRDDLLVHEISEAKGDGTNNMAEYLAVLRAIECARELELSERLLVRTDSKLVHGQIMEGWNVAEHLAWFVAKIRRERTWISIEWIPREQNEVADRLSKRALAPEPEENTIVDFDLAQILADRDRRVPALPRTVRRFLEKGDWSFDAFLALQSGRDVYSKLTDDETRMIIRVRHGDEGLGSLDAATATWKPTKRREALRWAARGLPVPLALRRQRAKDDKVAPFRR